MQARSFFGSYWKGSEKDQNRNCRSMGGILTRKATRDQITNLKAREHQQPLYMCFVDFKKAFNSISHNKLWVTMMDMGYPMHLSLIHI